MIYPKLATVEYRECRNQRLCYDHLNLLVRPLMHGNQHKPQLCPPIAYQEDGDDFSDCVLFSVVAWDHVSWPGNDFYAGSRATDDGVKAAATSSMAAITGIKGHYDRTRHGYQPPPPYTTWAAVVDAQQLKLECLQLLQIGG